MGENIAHEISTRDIAVHSLGNCYEFTERETFQNFDDVNDLIERFDYIQRVFDRFRFTHENLVQLATDQQEMAAVEGYHTLFDRMEETHLTTKARLSGKIRHLERLRPIEEPLVSDNDNDSDAEQEPNGPQNLAAHEQQPQNGENLQDNANEDEQNIGNANEQNNGIRNAQQPQQMAAPPPGYYPMQQFFIQCHGNVRASGKIENTCGDFDGTYSKWQGFHDRFKFAVHDNDSYAPAMKFQALWDSLKGKALDDLGDWNSTNAEYAEFWDRMKELYQRQYLTTGEILDKFNRLKKIERASERSLQNLSNVTNDVIRQLRALGSPVDQFDLIFVHGLHTRLDAETSKLWEMQRPSDVPTAKEMLAFLDRQARALGRVQPTEQKSLNFDHKRRWQNQSDSHGIRAKPLSNSGANSNSKEPCKVCKSIEHQALYECSDFKKRILSERRKKVSELKLCFNCLQPSHRSAQCTRGNCKRCDKKHNSLLCPENPLNHAVNVVQTGKKNVKKSNKKKNNRNSQ